MIDSRNLCRFFALGLSLGLSLVLALGFGAPGVAFADDSAHLQKLADDLEKAKKSLIDKEEQQRKVMSALFDINRKMKKLVTDQSAMNQQRLMLEATTRDLAAKILQVDEKLKSEKTLMRDRMVAIYKLGGQGLARLLFSSTSSSQLEKNLKILGIVAKRDLDLVKDYSATVEDLREKKSKFQIRLTNLKKLEKRIEEKEKNLTAENENKSKILEKIRQSKQFSISKLNGLRERTAKMKGMDDSGVLDLLFRPSFFEQKGQLPSPIAGNILRKFGVVRDEEHNVSWSQKGILISAPLRTSVKAVFDGSVAYVGDLPGFGATIIVDHGDHYYSVYGAASQVQVHEGDEIKQNQVLALSGVQPETGLAGVYFEIRHFSEPSDPQHWLKGSSL